MKQLRSVSLGEMAIALMELGRYQEARKSLEEALRVFEILRDLRNQGATLSNLGTLAMREDNLKEAADRHTASLLFFQRLREPASEAATWHQLGRIFEKAKQWGEAERHYRESARIEEELGNLAGAARTWTQLAYVNIFAAKSDMAEMWYRKGIEGGRNSGALRSASGAIRGLASLLLTQPDRLAEARQLANEALTIEQTLDPNVAEIWRTYNLLAQIAEQEAAACANEPRRLQLQTEAREHRRLARDANRNFAGARQELRQFAPLILATVAACARQPEAREAVIQHQQAMSKSSPEWQALSRVLDRLLAGEREETALSDGLSSTQALIIEAILRGLAEPDTSADLLSTDSPRAT